LLRDEELVCRASSGTIAPELGARLDRENGISGECLRTRIVQRCDEIRQAAQPRWKLLECWERVRRCYASGAYGEVVGIFEVLSTEPSAFGGTRSEDTGGNRAGISKNLERAERPLKFLNAPQTALVLLNPCYAKRAASMPTSIVKTARSRAFEARHGSLHFSVRSGCAGLRDFPGGAVRPALWMGTRTRRAYFVQHAPRKDDGRAGNNSGHSRSSGDDGKPGAEFCTWHSSFGRNGFGADGRLINRFTTRWSARLSERLQVFPENEPALELSPAEAQGSLIIV